jgi:L,D-peptidoglycan transpeptidase YkuD (ErfK/YbiS/YcfS/YnhG family)
MDRPARRVALAVLGVLGILLAAAVLPAGPDASAVKHDAGAWRSFLPYRMSHIPVGTTELITVRAHSRAARTAALDYWYRPSGDHWRHGLRAAARLGANGLVRGSKRVQLSKTTPIGIYHIRRGFGTVGKSSFPHIHYRPITHRSYFCEDNASRYYNRWVEQYPMTVCRASESEHLADYSVYRRAFVIEFNWGQVRHRGAGIFLHVNGRAWTGGCVSTDATTMTRLARLLHGRARPMIAIGVYGSNIQSL